MYTAELKTAIPPSRPVLLFDGVCNLCNGMVQYVIRHDRKERFLFAAFQSEAGRRVAGMPSPLAVPGSVVLAWKGRRYEKSDAMLQTFRLLGGWQSFVLAGWIIPRFIRDYLYELIARNRYRLFGKRDSCMIPSPELNARFLSE